MASGTRPQLLLVDDEPDMLDFLERVLRRQFVVTRCVSAEDALDRLALDRFDLLITDHKMPRMTGLELLEALGDRFPDLVKVLISGYTELPELQRAMEQCRLHGHIVKPVDAGRLVQAIDAAIAAHGRGGPPPPL